MEQLPKGFFKMYILLRDPEGMYSSPEPAKLQAPSQGVGSPRGSFVRGTGKEAALHSFWNVPELCTGKAGPAALS